MVMEEQEVVPVAVGVVDGGIGINFGRKHGLENDEHNEFLRDMLRAAGFHFPETVRYDRNKRGDDGRMYVDWMRLRISSDECQVNGVNPKEAVMHIENFLTSQEVKHRFDVDFIVKL